MCNILKRIRVTLWPGIRNLKIPEKMHGNRNNKQRMKLITCKDFAVSMKPQRIGNDIEKFNNE